MNLRTEEKVGRVGENKDTGRHKTPEAWMLGPQMNLKIYSFLVTI